MSRTTARSVIAIAALTTALAVTGAFAAPASAAEEAFGTASSLTTSLTLEVNRFGTDQARASGTLLDGEGNPVALTPLRLQSSVDGTAWAEVTTLSTDADGAFAGLVPLSRTMSFRAVYDGQPGVRDPATSTVVAVTAAPLLEWKAPPPARVYVGQYFTTVVSSSPSHTDTACVSTFHFEREESGAWVERKTLTVTGRYNATTTKVDHVVRTYLPGAGAWRIRTTLVEDTFHGTGELEPTALQVGVAYLTISASRTAVPVGGAVTYTGYLKNAVTGGPVTGRYIQVQTSTGGTWTTVATRRTSTTGKVSFTAYPRSRRYYRFVFNGDTRWQARTSAHKLIQTKFTMSGNQGGHFVTRKVWMSRGNRWMRITVTGSSQAVWVHLHDESERMLLANGAGVYSGYLVMDNPAYVHFYVYGDGYFKIETYN